VAEQYSIAQLLTMGIRAAKEKRREEACEILLHVIERDQYNEHAWLWLSGVVDDPRDMQVALANALTINPTNEQARKGLDMLRQRHGNLLQPDEEPPAAPDEAPIAVGVPLDEDLPPGAIGETLACYKCNSEINDVAETCWNCMAWVHCCENCSYLRNTECKQLMNIRGQATAVRNECAWWTPEGRALPPVPPWKG
jgi:hypothetical protein